METTKQQEPTKRHCELALCERPPTVRATHDGQELAFCQIHFEDFLLMVAAR